MEAIDAPAVPLLLRRACEAPVLAVILQYQRIANAAVSVYIAFRLLSQADNFSDDWCRRPDPCHLSQLR